MHLHPISFYYQHKKLLITPVNYHNAGTGAGAGATAGGCTLGIGTAGAGSSTAAQAL